MKKLITIILILCLLIPAAALADYSPRLGMTIDEYLSKYNSIEAPIGSPYSKLSTPIQWTSFNEYGVAWYQPAKNSSVHILLLTKDPEAFRSTGSGLDRIQIFVENNNDFVSFISIINRCAMPFSAELFGEPLSPMRVTGVIKYYYENGQEEAGGSAYWTLDENNEYALVFFKSLDCYYAEICKTEDAP